MASTLHPLLTGRTCAPVGRRVRVSSDSAWPLRGVDGLTFAERKALANKQMLKGA